jgi:hypothetical protein
MSKRKTPPRGRKPATIATLERVGHDLLALARWLDSHRRLGKVKAKAKKGGAK